MRLLSNADIELVATLALCARMGNARKVLERLRDRYEEPTADSRAMLEYGLCRAVFLLNDRNDSDKGPHQLTAVQAFTRSLDRDPQCWLPRFLRIELSSVMVGVVPGGVSVPPERDIETLLSLQAGVTDAPSYFLSTHAARLRARLRAGQVGEAFEEFAAATAATDVTAVDFSFPYLDLPFRESVLLLRHLGHPADAESVKATGLAIYRESLPLQVA